MNTPPAHAVLRLHIYLRSLLGFLILALAACSTVSHRPVGATTTFVVVRHAEKGNDDARDPSLSDAGRARALALALARLLADAPLSAVYATGYRRTQQTALPAAEAHGLTVTTYDAQSTAATFAAQLRAAHTSGTVLVVGHSNTVPEIVAALSGQPVEPMADTEFDRLYRVRIASDGTAMLEQSRY